VALELLRLSAQDGAPFPVSGEGVDVRGVGKLVARRAIRLKLCLQEKPLTGSHERPYRKPTLVVGCENTQVDE
jgi:hypothetical protein